MAFALLTLIQAKINQNFINSIQCTLWDSKFAVAQRGVTAPQYGRQKIVQLDERKKIERVHRLSFMLHNRIFDLPVGLDVIHLCHNSLCINVKHLNLEPHEINNSRQICKNLSPCKCTGHGEYPDSIFETGN